MRKQCACRSDAGRDPGLDRSTKARDVRRSGPGLRLAADVDHGAGRLEEAGFADVVAGFLALHGAVDVGAELGVGGAGAHAAVEVVLDLGEQAGADFAVGGEADAAAGSAEGLGDGGDDADFAGAVGRSRSGGRFRWLRAAGSSTRGRMRPMRATISLRGTTISGVQRRSFFKGHELDEADDDVFLRGRSGQSLRSGRR